MIELKLQVLVAILLSVRTPSDTETFSEALSFSLFFHFYLNLVMAYDYFKK